MFLLALLFVASASALVIRPPGVQVSEREICIPVFGVVNICADPHVSGKREEDLNLAEIVANIGKVVHVIDGFVSGTTKRELCVHIFGANVCADPSISGKREENLNLAEIVANIGKVVHVIDGFVSGTAKRELCVHIFGANVCADPSISGK